MSDASVGQRRLVPFLVGSKCVLIKKQFRGGLVLLYSPEVTKNYFFQSMINSAVENGTVCVYAGPGTADAIRVRESEKFQFFSLAKDNVRTTLNKISSFIDRLVNKGNVFIITDFSDAVDGKNLQAVVDFQKKITDKSKKLALHSINAFDVSTLNSSMIDALTSYNEKLAFISDGEMAMDLVWEKPKFSPPKSNAAVKVFSRKASEKFAKDTLEHIIYSMLLKGPTCGNDVIKKIANDYHVVLSQGTVYPMLYSLHKRGLVTVSRDSAAKKYAPTEEGHTMMKNELSAMCDAHKHFISALAEQLG